MTSRLGRTSVGVLLALLALGAAGCGDYGALARAGEDTVSVALPPGTGGTGRLFLYRTAVARTGERLGVGRSFRIEDGRQVRAVLQLAGLEPAQRLHLHLMWINPDGKAAYTKEVEVRPEDWRRPDRVNALAGEMVRLDPAGNGLELESRYGVGPDRFEEELLKSPERRTFKAGTWLVRAYLFRKLLLETSFELLPADAGADG